MATLILLCIVLCLFSGCEKPQKAKKETIQIAHREVPAWMDAQIQEDLAPFTSELSQKSIDALFANEALYLVRVRVTNGKLSIETSEKAKEHQHSPKSREQVADRQPNIETHKTPKFRLLKDFKRR